MQSMMYDVILLFKMKATLCRYNILNYIQSTGLLGILQMVVLLVLSFVDQYLKPVLSSIIEEKYLNDILSVRLA